MWWALKRLTTRYGVWHARSGQNHPSKYLSNHDLQVWEPPGHAGVDVPFQSSKKYAYLCLHWIRQSLISIDFQQVMISLIKTAPGTVITIGLRALPPRGTLSWWPPNSRISRFPNPQRSSSSGSDWRVLACSEGKCNRTFRANGKRVLRRPFLFRRRQRFFRPSFIRKSLP